MKTGSGGCFSLKVVVISLVLPIAFYTFVLAQDAGPKPNPKPDIPCVLGAGNCAATVPGKVTVGKPVQFQGSLPGSMTPGALYAVDSIVGNLRYAPAGTFIQGTPTSEPGHNSEAQFQHTLTKNLAVMETEVSQAMWVALRTSQGSLPTNPSDFSSNSSNPAERVTWYQALLFSNLLSLQQGLMQTYYTDAGFTIPITSTNYTTGPFYCNWGATGFRLPSEGEWEYLTRAGTTGPFSVAEPAYNSSTQDFCTLGVFGVMEGVAWFCANASSTTHPVGSKTANPWGLKDVHGNIFEWCWDWYDNYPTLMQTDYHGASSGEFRVLRGGSWFDVARYARSGNRVSGLTGRPGSVVHVIGFRLVRSLN